MGHKYTIRTSEVREFPLKNVEYTDYNTSNFFEYWKLKITKRKHLIYVIKRY